ncbi:MAG: hypothetical protein K2P81_12260 [Bacteriovoracaceae bacterium]|nr:hypothetical protein [Bacteriovoracaceae bacterium]
MKIIFIILLLGVASSCGQKSKVTPLFKAIPLKESHGDGQYAVFTVKLPLSDQSIEVYNSPIDPNSGLSKVPLLGDVLRMLTQATFNMGASLGLGKSRISINQPIPDLNSPYLKSLVVKRVFFHIDQKNILEEARPPGIWGRFRNLLRGRTALDFSFIRELKIRLKMDKEEGEPVDFTPTITTDDQVNEKPEANALPDEFEPIELLHYRRKYRSQVLRNSERGSMFVIYTQTPVQVRAFLRRDPELAALIKEIVIVNKSIVLELTGKQLESEKFFQLLEKYEKEMEQSGITKINDCDDDTCMDVRVNDQNMLPILLQGNKLKIETIIDSSKVPPKSFQLKGFVEFEVKLDVPL